MYYVAKIVICVCSLNAVTNHINLFHCSLNCTFLLKLLLLRKLQDDLTDEMVVLAKQLKESSLMMSQSVKNTEKV